MPNPQSIRSRVKATEMILTAGASADLPDPFHINLSGTSVRFMFDHLHELLRWTNWLGESATMTQTPAPSQDRVQHTTTATVFDEPIELVAYAPILCRCGHPKSAHTVFGAGCNSCTHHGGSCRCVGYRAPEALAVPA